MSTKLSSLSKVKKPSYTVSNPYLKNHKLHDFHQSLEKEKKIIENGEHLAVIHQLNIEFEKLGLIIDFESFEDNYGNDSVSKFKNKAGVDATFDLISIKTGEIVKKGFTIDYKFRDPNAPWNDFLAEIVSQDFGSYSNKMSVPGWALCNHKINDAILYILPFHKKATLVRRKELKGGFEQNKFLMNNRKYAKNKGWTTISVPIDWSRLTKVCPSTITFNYE
jgi:hypothetical protein